MHIKFEFFLPRLVFALLVVFVFSTAFPASATEIIHYKNKPVTIELRQGEERSIQFGDHVQVGISKVQRAKKLFRVQSAQGAIHILPYKVFEKQRIQIKRLGDGRVILLDLVADKMLPEAKPLEDLRFYLASENTLVNNFADENARPANTANVTPVELTRYAAQRLYGPTRLHRDNPQIIEVFVDIKEAIRVFNGPLKYYTESKVVLAYQGGGYYLSAIHVKNRSKLPQTLNYLDIHLPFTHATLQHHQLRPQGEPGDSTLLYLVTEHPLKDSLHPWSYYRDAQQNSAAEKPHNDKLPPRNRRRP